MKKKILSILLSTAFGLGAVFAGYSANTLTTLAADANITHEYAAYQIFTATYDEDNANYTDVEWGSGATDAVKAVIAAAVTPVDKDNNPIQNPLAKDYAIALSVLDSAQDPYDNLTLPSEQLAANINKALTKDDKALALAVNSTTKKIAGDATGWYLIVDVTQLTAEQKAADYEVYLDRAQLQLYNAGSVVTINSKHSDVTILKEVMDTNDSVEVTYQDENGWKKTADYDIGDSIPFQITGTLPADFDTYSSYEYTFADTQALGLWFQEDTVKVYKNEVKDANLISTNYYTVTKIEDNAQHTFEVKFADLKADGLNLVKTDKIILQYKSILNGDGVQYGVDGNPNKARIEFKNDKDGEGRTPWDIAIVFTFKPLVDKVDSHGSPLAGAEFTLSKLVKGEGELSTWEVVTREDGTKYEYKMDMDDSETHFSFNGIDDGVYRIVETKVPDNYNKADDIYLEVKAYHDNATGTLTKIEIYDLVENKLLVTATSAGTVGDIPVSFSEGTFTETVINNEGVVLPSTGGIGTTIFYVIGGVLVVGAVVLLIVRRKMRTEEE